MTANELRIGNWIELGEYASGQPHYTQVLSVDSHQKETGTVETADKPHMFELSSASPIPLTPEILESMELKGNNGGRGYLLKIGALEMYIRFNADHCYSECGGIYMGDRITYVHQLQNLYNILTGQELNIQP